MIDQADVVIIGGGINGCALAYELSKRDTKVVVVERSSLAAGATGRCGAGIRQQWSTHENVMLAMQSVRIFEQLEEELGASIGFRQGGYLIAINEEEDMQQVQQNVAMQRSLGLDIAILDPDAITDIVPILDVKGMRSIGATFCPTDGHADPFKTTYAYANAAYHAGTSIYLHSEIMDILTKNGTIQGVRTDKKTIQAPVVVNAAGAWSKQIAAMVGLKLPNIPFKKEIIVTERMARIFDAMVISFKDGIYFSQQDEGQILGGIPPPETVTGYHQEPTFSFLTHMASTITRYAPVLQHINVIRQWTGFYDVTPDARPILGPVEEIDGFIQCHGFSGHGFMLAPVVARLLAELIVDTRSSPFLEHLNIARFATNDLEREQSVVG